MTILDVLDDVCTALALSLFVAAIGCGCWAFSELRHTPHEVRPIASVTRFAELSK